MHVRAGALRHDHVLGDLLAHGGHGHEFAGGDAADRLQRRGDGRSRRSLVARLAGAAGAAAAAGSRCSAGVLGDKSLDVFLGDAAAEPGAGNFGQVDVVLLGDLADERAGADAVPARRLRASGSRLRGLGGAERAAVAARLLSWLRARARLWLGRAQRRPPSPSPMTPTTVLTCTVAPASTLISCRRAGGGRGDFGVNFVGGDFEQRLVALDFVAGLLEPLGDGSFEDRFPHLGHDDICRHGFLPQKCWLEIRARTQFHIISREKGHPSPILSSKGTTASAGSDRGSA